MQFPEYEKCSVCPRNCGISRNKAKGYCLCGSDTVISKIMLHKWEEPYICTKNGSGAVFFSGCPLKCVYCQNYGISSQLSGDVYSVEEMAEEFLRLQNEKGACNINLITASPYIPAVREALISARNGGLIIPTVFNSSGYETVGTLRSLDGLIDIYLPDMKYYSSELSEKYSKCRDYYDIAVKAITEMISQVGTPVIENGEMKKGVIIRHLVLPNHKDDSVEILKRLKENFGTDSFILSLMSQFVPTNGARRFKELSRRVTTLEYQKVTSFAEDIGFEYIFTQQRESASESFIPDFFEKTDKGDNL